MVNSLRFSSFEIVDPVAFLVIYGYFGMIGTLMSIF